MVHLLDNVAISPRCCGEIDGEGGLQAAFFLGLNPCHDKELSVMNKGLGTRVVPSCYYDPSTWR